MGARYLTDLPAVCAAAGLIVHTEPGWETRARGSGGYASGAPNHVMIHHTASNTSPANDVAYMCHGSENAPIANLYLARTGEVWIMAAGATNTNGTGTDSCGRIAADTMNANAVGIEAANDGVGEPWPTVQQDAYVRLVDALCAAYGIAPAQVHAHIEWAPGRKIDPAGPARWPPVNASGSWDASVFRADLGGGPGPLPPPVQESTMLVIFRVTDAAQPGVVYVTNGLFYRWIDNQESYDALVLFMALRGMDTTQQTVTRVQLDFAGQFLANDGSGFGRNPNL